MNSKPALEVLFPNRKIKTRSQQLSEKNSPAEIQTERSPMNSPPAFALRTLNSRPQVESSKIAILPAKKTEPTITSRPLFPLDTKERSILAPSFPKDARRRPNSPPPLRTQAIMKAIMGNASTEPGNRLHSKYQPKAASVETKQPAATVSAQQPKAAEEPFPKFLKTGPSQVSEMVAEPASDQRRSLLALLRSATGHDPSSPHNTPFLPHTNTPPPTATSVVSVCSEPQQTLSAVFLPSVPLSTAVPLQTTPDSETTEKKESIADRDSPPSPTESSVRLARQTAVRGLQAAGEPVVAAPSPAESALRRGDAPDPHSEPAAETLRSFAARPPTSTVAAGAVNYPKPGFGVMQSLNNSTQAVVADGAAGTGADHESLREREKVMPGERIVYINDALSGLHGPRLKGIAQELYRCRRSVYENNKRKLDDSGLHDYLEQKADEYMKWQYQNRYGALEANFTTTSSSISQQLTFQKSNQARPSMQEAIASLRKVNMNIAKSHNKYASYYEAPSVLGKRIPLASDALAGL